MKQSTARKRAIQKLTGGDENVVLDMSWIDQIKGKAAQTPTEKSHTLELESVLRSLHAPHAYVMRKCKHCGDLFQTNYCYVAYCSDTCIIAEFRKMGIEYDPRKGGREHRHETFKWSVKVLGEETKEIFWEYEPPEMISTQMLASLEYWARNFLSDVDRLKEKALDRDLDQFQENDPNLQGSSDYESLVPFETSALEAQQDSSFPQSSYLEAEHDPLQANLPESLEEEEYLPDF